ncbi:MULTISPECIES: RNA-binding cell elongation regulator Jag/EloR [Enterococcus]|uniref:RNA-binding protein KhpB n=1 Tax=Enterococcus sulfureus ATCC 49903 TaxID=1140003 RepID=S0L016_9ENTE|nr:RNA-binding cell elongation regulator Jag/EloR [Enterococcus sulfureus]EOT46660.1 hypothetical protein OMY_01809 [Enterococcus sulfureus ATCC 49903]EOT86028.1 hypothetical protein I573_00781 [Enterococcus sulfureus ATCC 49903]
MPIFTASTSTIAIEDGLRSLGISKDEATITILQEAKKGIFGLGKKEAKVQIERKQSFESQKEVELVEHEVLVENLLDENSELPTVLSTEPVTEESALEELRVYLETIARQLISTELVTVELVQKKEIVLYQINTSKQGLLIGKHGKTLNALQYLAQVFLHRKWKEKRSIVVNVGDYREKRQEILERLAEKTAQKVTQTKRPIFLEPMPAFERKQIHAVLSKNGNVQTHSEGDEPYRYLVIEPKA